MIASFFLLFSPFLLSSTPAQSTLQVIHRMFPWARGLFEDKVASFWCTINNVVKINTFFTSNQLKVLCLVFTLLALTTSLVLLWKTPTLESVCLALFINSLSFFLFSYHGIPSHSHSFIVHEKTILFSLIPLLMISYAYPNCSKWFILICSYSMIPLFIKDHNLIMAIAVALCFFSILPPTNTNPYMHVLSWITAWIMIASVLYYTILPPKRYPDLHSVIISAFSCFLFFVFYLLMSYYHFQLKKSKKE